MTPACPLPELVEGECRAVADGEVLLSVVAGRVVAYRNQCLHRGARLETGVVRDGVVTCPRHFWRYRLADGGVVGGDAGLAPVPVAVIGDEMFVERPRVAAGPIREQLLEHARTWRREG